MPRRRFTEEQSIGVLQEAETGVQVPDRCRQHGSSDGTFYAWKATYGGLTVRDARRVQALEDENRRVKQLVAEQALDTQAVKGLVATTASRPRRSGRPWGW